MPQQPLGPARPLDGLRVLDLSRDLSGPFAGRIPAAPLEAKLRARVTIIGEWVAGHDNRDALKRDLERAKLAWAEIRHAGDVLNSPTVAARGTIVTVTDSDGEPRPVVRMPYRFSNAGSGPVRGVPEIGEHTKDVLAEWAGRAD